VNTTAADLSLGTGGEDFVLWPIGRTSGGIMSGGHVMKLRYTPVQMDTLVVESQESRHHDALASADSLDGMPVIACSLHSQVAAAAALAKARDPGVRIAYVMTDGGALPLAMSNLVADLTGRGLIDVTLTCGHAFGGDHEAVSVFSALAVARHLAGADAAVVAMGPGVVGTASRLGFSGLEVGPVLDAATALGGTAIACLRASFADPRERHQGLSHHSATALRLACRSRVALALPALGGPDEARLRADLAAAGLDVRHEVVAVETPDVLDLFAGHGLEVTSMGRPAADDPVLFACGAAAGVLAAARLVR
ncbi:MAG: DUF3866 family protein, partial [Acidimicrobiales bacterium]